MCLDVVTVFVNKLEKYGLAATSLRNFSKIEVQLTEELHSCNSNHHFFGKAKRSSKWKFELVLCNVYKV